MNAILSIKPQFVEEIFAGRKCFEYRKSEFKQKVNTVFIYASSPISRIVGEFKLGDILEDSPEQIWSLTRHYSGISKSFFDEYFLDRKTAIALEIKALKRYKTPINPFISIKGFRAPQSFCYTDLDNILAQKYE